MEKITAPNGKVWRLSRGTKPDGAPADHWHACTGGAAHSTQWKFGANREAVLSRIMGESV
jgi:hypothetical protein